ncbi:MAG: NAD(P)-dependent oxidoreductase [Pseudomonadota bacterium]
MARVMVTGANGHIGSVLVDHLLKENHQVVAVDWMIYGAFPLTPFQDNPGFELLQQDLRTLPVSAYRGIDIVVDASGLPNEQTCTVDPALAKEINVQARARIARIAKAMGVRRHIALTSAEPPTGKDLYGRCNAQLEQTVLSAAADGFSTTVLRAGSVYGLSRRMRFDVMANVVALHAHMGRRVTFPGSAQTALPFIHVRDLARAAVSAIAAPEAVLSGQVFTVASQIQTLQELLAEASEIFPGKIDYVFSRPADGQHALDMTVPAFQDATGFAPRITLDQGLLEVFIALKGGRTKLGETTNTAKFYRSLIKKTQEAEARL